MSEKITEYLIQINGRAVTKIRIAGETPDETIKEIAGAILTQNKQNGGTIPIPVIVPGKLVNIIMPEDAPKEYNFQCVEWHQGEPIFRDENLSPIMRHWICPIYGCDGEMISNGMNWPVNPPGYHHTCFKCGYTAAISGQQYPGFVHDKAKS